MTSRHSSVGTDAESRSVKARLFGEDSSDRLQKQVIKARLLRQLQHPTGGIDTHEEVDGSTEPSAKALNVQPVRIGRYAVLRKLGQGGMGVVYVAYDEDLDRKVAIKLLRGELSKDDRGRARMLREAQALARLSHPNVVQVHEVSRWNDHDYVAMEYVEGCTFDKWLAAEPRSWRTILDAVIQAGRGLEAAHAAGLIHRDFKPANVLVGADGRARVLDFGLARSADERTTTPPVDEVVATAEHRAREAEARSEHDLSSQSTASTSAFDKTLTVTGAVLGTPAYMAPEQHLGQGASEASDQFSFCVVLFEALYGRRPFRGSSRAQYAESVIEGNYEIPVEVKGVPAWLRKIVVRGLAPRPEDRWPSMAALLAELGRDRTRSGRRFLVAVGVLAAFGVALAVGGNEPELCAVDGSSVADTWGDEQREAVREAFAGTGMTEAAAVLDHAERSLDAYAEELVAARGQACEARWLEHSQTDAQLELRNACLEQRERELGAVVEVLADADREVILHAPELVAELGEIGLCARVDLLEAGTPAPRDAEAIEKIADTRELIARAHAARDAGRTAEARALTAEAGRSADQIGFEPLRGELLNLEARNARYQRDDAKAREYLVSAVAIAERNNSYELAVQAWINLAFVVAQSGVQPDGNLEFELAAAAIERLGPSNRYTALLSYARALALRNTGRLDPALAALDRGLELAKVGFVGSEQLISEILMTRSDTYAKLGRVKEARADLEQVLKVRAARGRTELDALFDLGVIELEDHQLDRAERDIRAAMQGYEGLFGPRYDAIGHGHLALAHIALEREDHAAADRALERAALILHESHPDHDWLLDARTTAYLARKDYDSALRTIRSAIAHHQRTNGNDETRLGYLQERLGAALRETGDLEGALVEYDRAISLLDQPGMDAPLDLAAALLGRGYVRQLQGQASLALGSLERAVELASVDCGRPWLAGEARVALAEVLHQLGIRGDERRELALDAVALLREIPGSAEAFNRALELSKPSARPQPTLNRRNDQ